MPEMRVTLPRVAETIDQSYVAEFLANVGDSVSVDQPILKVETDKAIVEIPSAYSGVLTAWLVDLDQEIFTGKEIAVITTPG